ncbi:ScbA/BarX family gamma-butyrolactone biosynthesis protein [Streptomyces sp. RTd22]|uniref:ScbA/BarX family gamma-butyrolactone biosynthesis protein n=1 Tax=Streptomyces sp. RTd22 TaxID=1841249 RepID=UPI0007C50D71|nr:ScbA/BarX family gamma-butyrolactone biosynthesis protein [Streptomyces sp. RTd22]
MTVATEAADARVIVPDLDFSRTVPKDLVHREALSELFLTDSRKVTDGHFVAAAQIPPSHAYYTDHTDRSPIDPLLLLECCRQAETHAVHAHFGAPRDTVFILQSWSMRLPGAATVRIGPGPAELVMDVTTRDSRWRDGTLLATTYVMRLSMAGQYLGEVSLRAAYMPGGTYAAMRTRRRGSTPPTSDAFRYLRAGTPVPPGRVGRTREENVVLLDAVTGPGSVSARLRPAGEHPSLFDHPLDHFPGMVLMEAGRQLGLLHAAEHTRDTGRPWALTELAASFQTYAELDSPLLLTARRASRHEPDADAELRLSIAFEQDEQLVAEADIALTRAQRPVPEDAA